MLARIDRGLAAMLRLSALSSPGFELTASKHGPAERVRPAVTKRLQLVLNLLVEHSKEYASPSQFAT